MNDLSPLNAIDAQSVGDMMALVPPGSIDWGGFIVGCIFGMIGFFAFLNGKKNAAGWRMAIGIALMVYPYFVQGILWTCLVGAGLTVALFLNRE